MEVSDSGVLMHAHLGDLVGEELHDNSARRRTANGDVEEDAGVGHFDGVGCEGGKFVGLSV